MSTKTLRKRIALVAVSALGFGLLSSISANATDLAAANISIGTGGVCKDQGDETAAATARYVSVGSRTVFTIATGVLAGTGTITGNAKWVSTVVRGTDATVANSNTINASGKILTVSTAGQIADVTLEVTGTGPIQLLWEKASDGADLVTYYFIAQATCASGYDSTTSYANLTTDSQGLAATTNVDVAAATLISYNASGQASYLRYDANDAYGVDIAESTSTATATATGGCKLSFTETDTVGATTISTSGTGADNNGLVIIGDNTPRVCTVTVTLDGVVVALKTVKFLGEVATLEVVAANSSNYWAYGVDGSTSTTQNLNAIAYVAKDSAGNVINPSAAPTFVGLTGGATQVTTTGGTKAFGSSTDNGYAQLDVIATGTTTRGAATYQLKLVRASDGVAVYSKATTVEINKTPYTFGVSFDKASYQVGDIITLTITAKDDAGNLVADGNTVGNGTYAGVSVSLGGVTAFSTPTATDAYTDGVAKYKFTAGTTAASYGYSVYVTTGSAQSAITGTIAITNPAGGVSNAEVLAAIVKLIASINKQITALQKMVTKKK